MEFHKFTPELLQITRDAWLAAATAADIPSIEYEMNLDWAAKHIDYTNTNGDSYAYGIFLEPGGPAVAIVDIVYRRMSGPDVGWLKMLTLMLSPDYAHREPQDEASRLIKILELYAHAISGTIKLTGQHAARVVKLYSRSDSQFRLLSALNEILNQTGDMKSEIQGRWLVLTTV